MANDLMTAMLMGQNQSPLAADPNTMALIPQVSLAQTMMQGALSGAPAYPAQALGRLAQALVGGQMMGSVGEQVSSAYDRSAQAMAKIYPAGTPIGDMLRSDDPYTKVQGVQMASKAALINSENKALGPEQTVVAPRTAPAAGEAVASGSPAQAGAVEAAKNPALVSRAGGEAAARAPYEAGGEITVPGGPSGTQTIQGTADTRRRMQPGGDLYPGASGPTNPLSLNGQPQNLTGEVIPPGGANAHMPPPADMRAKPQPPAAPAGLDPYGQRVLQAQQVLKRAGYDVPVTGQMDDRTQAALAEFDQKYGMHSPTSATDVADAAQRNAAGAAAALPAGKPVETPQYKGSEKLYAGAEEARGKVLGERIEAGGKAASDKLNALDTIESAMRTNEGKGIVTGPLAERVLKVKEMLDGMGIKTDWVHTGMAQSEMIQKMNAQLASASAKAMTGRPTQFEFTSWVKNNPGLLTSKEGSLALIDVLRQTTRQDMELGKLAQNKANWDNFADVTEKYYAEHPLINPLTGHPMQQEIEAARGAPGSFDWRMGGAQNFGPPGTGEERAVPAAQGGGIPQLNPGDTHDLGSGWTVTRVR